jgi:NAD(P)-dependent dehydrogenase (short-subunit alcohol dehydrogenase family)
MVSGASRGIGRKVVDDLLNAGFIVSAGVRDPAAMPAHDRLFVHRYDAADAGSPKAWVAATVEKFARLDALVNAAGINPKALLMDEDETALDRTWAINVKGPMRLIRAALPALRAAGAGRVVNIASLSGKRVANDNVGYAMSKFALLALTQAVRRQGWDDGVRATAVCPGFVATDMTAHVTNVPRAAMTDAADVAVLVRTALLLPNNATVGEILVNWRLEPLL